MWQQAGRAGRREASSLSMLIAQDDPLDQYLAQHPAELFERPPEDAVIDPTNPYVIGPHLRCAARERPLADEETKAFFGNAAVPAVEELIARGDLARRPTGMIHDVGRTSPHREVDIRAGSGHVYRIVRAGTGELLGTSDEHRAFGTLHPGAVYLHQGEQYLVRELDLVGRVALVDEADPDFYTQARDVTDIRIVDLLDHRPLGEAEVSFGDVHVTNEVVGYVRKSVATSEIIGDDVLALPPVTLETRATWWTLPTPLIDGARVAPRDLPGGIHAAEHCAIGLLPLVAPSDRWASGGASSTLHVAHPLSSSWVYYA
jgi:DEAD/DEAH box helicase domain-containing protein